MGSRLYDNARLHVVVIKRSHSGGLGILLAFPDIVVAFVLFCKSAINLLIIVTILYTPIFPLFAVRNHIIACML